MARRPEVVSNLRVKLGNILGNNHAQKCQFWPSLGMGNRLK